MAEPLGLQGALRFRHEAKDRSNREVDDYMRSSMGVRGGDVSDNALDRSSSRVLIVTRHFDPHADVVAEALRQMSVECLRLDTEDLHSYQLEWSSGRPGLIIGDRSGRSVDLSRVSACFFRCPIPGPPHPGVRSAEATDFSAKEAEAFLQSIYALPGVRWVSPPAAVLAARPKLVQLAVAQNLGFRVPQSIATNDPQMATRFIEDVAPDIVVKPLATASLSVGDVWIETLARRLSEDELRTELESLRLAPTLLQEYIPKVAEIRVTVIGETVFAVRRTLSGDEETIDWTRLNANKFDYEVVKLPVDFEVAVRAFLKHYGLLFGAIDLLETRDEELVFLENNPTGAWYWLELETGLPLVKTMAELLAGP